MVEQAGRRAGYLVLVAAALTALLVAYLVWGPFPMGLDDWQWHRVGSPVWEAALLPLIVYAFIGFLSLVAWQRWERLGRRKQALFVAALCVLAFAAQVVAAKQLPSDYNQSIIALGTPSANRYHAEARRVKALGAVLRGYQHWMRDGSHKLIITHPGGPLTLFWCLNRLFAGNEAAARRFVSRCEDLLAGGVHVKDPQGPAEVVRLFRDMSEADLAGVWLATFVLRLAAAMVVWPVFALARAMRGLQAAIVAAAFCAVVPSFLFFSPGVDQALPAIALAACWLGWTSGARRSPWRAAVSGVAVSVGLFFSMSFAVVALWAALLCLAALWTTEGPRSWRGAGALAAAAAAGFAAPALTLWLALGYNSVAVWRACLAANAEFNAQSGRVYWKWLLANPVEFLVFLGVPVACLFLAGAASAVRRLWRKGALGQADWPTLIVAGLLVALNLAGANRGEAARLWMFLMPGCVIAAAGYAESCAPYRRVVLVALFVLQAVQATAFGSLLDMLGMYRRLA